MKRRVVKLAFNKQFFAKMLLTKPETLRYVFLVYKDEEETIRRPAIAVAGITKWAFDIETSNFIKLGTRHSLEKASVGKSKDFVTFTNADGNKETIILAGFYRHYMTKVANTLLV